MKCTLRVLTSSHFVSSLLLRLLSLGIVFLHQELLLNLRRETGINADLYLVRKEKYHDLEVKATSEN